MKNQEDHPSNLVYLIERAETTVASYLEHPDTEDYRSASAALEDIGRYLDSYGENINRSVHDDLRGCLQTPEVIVLHIWAESAAKSPGREDFQKKLDIVRDVITKRLPAIRAALLESLA